MKAAYISAYGGLDVINYGEIPDPVLKSDKLIIQVKAVSINPLDYKLRHGDLKLLSGSKFPKIPGADFSGIIKEIGDGVKDFRVGEKIYGYIPLFFGKNGALSELISVSPKQIRLIPEGMTFEEAASLPVAALTALNGLRKSGNLKGKQILINGATGGVGHFAMQIAKAKGAILTAICGTKNIDLAKQFSADEVIDYNKEDITKIDKKYDVIFDAFGKMDFKNICRLLPKKGVYSSTLFMPTAMLSAIFIKVIFNKKLTSANMRAKPEDFQEIEKLFQDKKIKPLIENIFKLENAKEAFNLIENGKPRGKIIIIVGNKINE